ncbi:MAG: hypothetical protein AMXMBFR56_24250 [Polyangiaceae bacterium]
MDRTSGPARYQLEHAVPKRASGANQASSVRIERSLPLRAARVARGFGCRAAWARELLSGAFASVMSHEQPKNPLHGITLERIVTELADHYGWPELGERVDIRCFQENPSVASSLKFLRRTPWARAKVESLYLFMLRERERAGRA